MWYRNTTIVLGAVALVCASRFDAAADPIAIERVEERTVNSLHCSELPDTVEALDIDVDLLVAKGDVVAGQDIDADIIVSNTLDDKIEVLSIEVESEIIQRYFKAPGAKGVLTSSVGPGRLALWDREARGVALDARRRLVYPARFSPPRADGYYKDVVIAKWRYAGSDVVADVQKPFTYVIEDGVLTVIDREEFETNTGSYIVSTTYKNGVTATQLAAEGYENPMSTLPKNARRVNAVPIELPEQGGKVLASDDYENGLEDDGVPSLGGGAAVRTIRNLSYCINLYYLDNFVLPPTDTTAMLWWRPYGYNGTEVAVNHMGIVVDLYDYDSSGGDDYIGSWVLNYNANNTYACINFSWDTVAQGEEYPDPYILTNFRVHYPNRDAYFCTDSCACATKPVASWRGSYTSNLGQSGTSVSKSFYYGTRTSSFNAMAMQSAALHKFLLSWGDVMTTPNLFVHWQDNDGGWSSGETCINLGYASGGSDLYRRWDAAPHEGGHCLHHQLLGAALYNTCASPHYGYCSYTQHCATVEGWAYFTATRTWYPGPPTYAQPTYNTQVNTYPIEPGGTTFLNNKAPNHADCGTYACSLDAACYAKNELMAARAYWDLYDNSVDGIDTADVSGSHTWHAQAWTLFPTGTGNAQNNEAYPYFNMRDFHHNTAGVSTDFYNDTWIAWSNNYMNYQSWP